MSKITVIGSCNVDLVTYTSSFPKPGETVHGTAFETGLGGKGSNQCIAAAKLTKSGSCRMIGAVGTDLYGKMFIDEYDHIGIDRSNLLQVNAATGVAPITVNNETGENQILIIPGANLQFQFSSNEKKIFSDCFCVCLQNEIDPKTTKDVIDFCHENDIFNVLNPSPVTGIDIDFINKVSCLVLNEHEYRIIFGDLDLETVFQKCRNLCLLIQTEGAKGAKFCLKSRQSWTSVAINRNVNVVDTTGAGDCFLGAFIAFLHNYDTQPLKISTFPSWGKPALIEKALSYANNAASMSVEKKGTSKSYPLFSDLGVEDFPVHK